MKAQKIESSKTTVSFVVERCESGVLVSRYDRGDMQHSRHSTSSFAKAVEAAKEDLRFFEKNPLTRISPISQVALAA